MAGILDPKTRILDSVITQEGKRQIANGGLRAVYATVSDQSTYYEKSLASGSADATKRIYFESPIEDINDSIIMESDDSGKLLGYPIQGPEFYNTDGVISGRSSVSGTLVYETTGSVAGFNSLADGVVGSSIERFKNLYTIGTRDADEPDTLQMKISPSTYTFTMNNKFPFVSGPTSATSDIDTIEPLFWDEMLANVENFKFLPPLKNEQDSYESFPRSNRLGEYVKFQRPDPLNLEKILNHMNIFPDMSGSSAMQGDPDAVYDESQDSDSTPYMNESTADDSSVKASEEDGSSLNLSIDQLPRERVSVFFRKTSSTNNLMMQMFELDSESSKLTKLDVIDFGTVYDGNDTSHPRKHIFFAGKIFINSIGLPTFVKLFTIIMD